MDLERVYQVVGPFWLVWLIIVFAAIVYWAYRPKNKKRFEKDAQIPLKDDE